MLDPHCAHCGGPARLLTDLSRQAFVNYYRCDGCGHVWTNEKNKPNSPDTPVTIDSTKRRDRDWKAS